MRVSGSDPQSSWRLLAGDIAAEVSDLNEQFCVYVVPHFCDHSGD
jgi:hypothetical protein